MSTPAERLLKAAEILEKRATEAEAGPWRTMVMGSEGSKVLGGGDTVSTSRHVALVREDWTARYIATMSPDLGRMVADALRYEAHKTDILLPNPHLVALADLVLAGEQERVER